MEMYCYFYFIMLFYYLLGGVNVKFVYDFKFLAIDSKVSKKGNPYFSVSLMDSKSADTMSVLSVVDFGGKKFGDTVTCVCELDVKYKNLKILEVK